MEAKDKGERFGNVTSLLEERTGGAPKAHVPALQNSSSTSRGGAQTRPGSQVCTPFSILTSLNADPVRPDLDRTNRTCARVATNPAPDYYAEKVGSLRQYRSCVPFSLYSSVEGLLSGVSLCRTSANRHRNLVLSLLLPREPDTYLLADGCAIRSVPLFPFSPRALRSDKTKLLNPDLFVFCRTFSGERPPSARRTKPSTDNPPDNQERSLPFLGHVLV